jgi:hypothetical protein
MSFDFEKLRMSQDFRHAETAVKKEIGNVPIKKPHKTSFFRVKDDPECSFPCLLLEIKDAGEQYVVAPDLAEEVRAEARAVMLYLAIDRQNNPSLIPVPLPDSEGRLNPWHASLASVVDKARTAWVRMQANRNISGYDSTISTGDIPEPVWPPLKFLQIVEIATKGKIIDTRDHPVLRALRGEI